METAYLHIIHWLEQHQLPCLFRRAFHIDCPGCGLQRSAIYLLKGQVKQSLLFYPALLPMLLLFTYLLVNKTLRYRFPIKFAYAGMAILFLIILSSYIYKISSY